MPGKFTVLILGDIYGNPGIRALFVGLKSLKQSRKADLVVVNGENAADGLGIKVAQAEQLFSIGVDVITSGNHIWHHREINDMLNSKRPILRPANYPPGVPGKGYTFVDVKSQTVGVLNLQGRSQMQNIDCPFRTGKEIIRKMREKTNIIIIDFHAESTEEKESLSMYLDGQISALVGTHTHVQTSDEKILPGGTAYISDLGMTGPGESVIGSSKDISISRSLSQMPLKLEVSETSAIIEGVLLDIDIDSGRTLKIERIHQQSLV